MEAPHFLMQPQKNRQRRWSRCRQKRGLIAQGPLRNRAGYETRADVTAKNSGETTPLALRRAALNDSGTYNSVKVI